MDIEVAVHEFPLTQILNKGQIKLKGINNSYLSLENLYQFL